MNDHTKARIDKLLENSGQSPAGTAQLAILLAYNAILQENILLELQYFSHECLKRDP